MHVHIPVKSITKICVRTEKRDGRTEGNASDGRTTPKQYPPQNLTAGDNNIGSDKLLTVLKCARW